MNAERLQREIDMVTASMRTDAESQREYSIGALSALLWVQSDGEMMRPMCFIRACETWDNVRRAVTERRQ